MFIVFLVVICLVLIFYGCKAELDRLDEEQKRRILVDQEIYVINHELKKIKEMIDKKT